MDFINLFLLMFNQFNEKNTTTKKIDERFFLFNIHLKEATTKKKI